MTVVSNNSSSQQWRSRNVELVGHYRDTLPKAVYRGGEARSADQSTPNVEKKFTFSFQLSGWALVAPSHLWTVSAFCSHGVTV